MNGIIGSKARYIIVFAVLLPLSLLAFTLQPVRAQAPLDLSWAFDYSPLVSGATDSLHFVIRNTALAPIRLLSVEIRFSWKQADNYLSTGNSQTISAEQQVRYSFTLAIPANVLTGRYSMTTLLRFQRFQIKPNQWGEPEPLTYIDNNVVVWSRSSPFSIRFDAYDGRIYSTIALITLLGWYLPKRLRLKAKG